MRCELCGSSELDLRVGRNGPEERQGEESRVETAHREDRGVKEPYAPPDPSSFLCYEWGCGSMVPCAALVVSTTARQELGGAGLRPITAAPDPDVARTSAILLEGVRRSRFGVTASTRCDSTMRQVRLQVASEPHGCPVRSMAEAEGFEPPMPFDMPVFKTGAFSRSATPPSGGV